MKKIISMSILAFLVVFLAVPAYAADGTQNAGIQGVITPQFTYISVFDSGPVNRIVRQSHLLRDGFCLQQVRIPSV